MSFSLGLVYTTQEKFENTTITGHFRCVFEENSGWEITGLSRSHRLRETTVSKCYPSTLERAADDLNSSGFEERFGKAPFSLRISVDGRPKRRNKALFNTLLANCGRSFSLQCSDLICVSLIERGGHSFLMFERASCHLLSSWIV